jgi:hypothetical protein
MSEFGVSFERPELAERGTSSDSTKRPLRVAHQSSRREQLVQIVEQPFSARDWVAALDRGCAETSNVRDRAIFSALGSVW